MEFLQWSLLFLAILMAFSRSSQGYVFNVGGHGNWTANPSEDYNAWAGRNRFQINDTLIFKYEKGQSSVLVVKEDDYYKCNVENPIEKYTDGYTELRFGRSGPFYFIGGSAGSCQQGQRLIVVVVAVRQGSPSPSPPVPAGSPPALSPPSYSPEGSPSHDGHSPAPSPSPHGSAPGLARPVGLVLGIGFGVSMVLGNFFGL